jgi:hypothetical protein
MFNGGSRTRRRTRTRTRKNMSTNCKIADPAINFLLSHPDYFKIIYDAFTVQWLGKCFAAKMQEIDA